MPWKPEIAPGEVVLVDCDVTARQRVEFHLLLTERRLIWARSTMLSLDGRVTESQSVDRISDARLSSRRPYFMWLLGAFLLLLVGFVAVSGHLADDWHASLLLLAGTTIVFITARPRWRLRWRYDGKNFSLATPRADRPAANQQMADALGETQRLLADAGARALKVRAHHLAQDEEQRQVDGEREREAQDD